MGIVDYDDGALKTTGHAAPGWKLAPARPGLVWAQHRAALITRPLGKIYVIACRVSALLVSLNKRS
jgi:hypothetical protein